MDEDNMDGGLLKEEKKERRKRDTCEQVFVVVL